MTKPSYELHEQMRNEIKALVMEKRALRTTPEDLRAELIARCPELEDCPPSFFERKHITYGLNHAGVAVSPESADFSDFYLFDVTMAEQDARRIADRARRSELAKRKLVSA